MSAPTPAAVRFVLKPGEATPEERAAYYTGGRARENVLREHIRAVASQLRSEAIGSEDSDWEATAVVDMLRRFADKLEGLK